MIRLDLDPKYNTLKVDSDAIKISDPNDNTRYISPLTICVIIFEVGITEASFHPYGWQLPGY